MDDSNGRFQGRVTTCRYLIPFFFAAALAGCGGGGADVMEDPTTEEPPDENSQPTLSGSPAGSATVGQSYVFQPAASDADGDTLSFSISGRPGWANFDTTTGRLSGTPTQAGSHSNIVVSVSDGSLSASLPAFSISVVTQPPPNRAPTIAGTPPASVMAGQSYVFQPSASDPDGNPLTFSIQTRPSWATFNTQTGRLSGTPSQAGTYSNIVISVSDGSLSASLQAFSITVNQAVVGSATLMWQPPTTNADGSPLTDLAGYRIYYGTSAGNLDQVVTIQGTGNTSHVVNGLSGGTWYFGIRAYDSDGLESALSNVVSTTIA
ncbi:MAG: putative Ig domain-containing protein [Gammaproteobacteria bacterium]|nr:putative Ig domain-containing protein [Gammaproteobacteria bacterium]